jgi:hypothetical protein
MNTQELDVPLAKGPLLIVAFIIVGPLGSGSMGSSMGSSSIEASSMWLKIGQLVYEARTITQKSSLRHSSLRLCKLNDAASSHGLTHLHLGNTAKCAVEPSGNLKRTII